MTDITFRNIEYFQKVVELGGLTRAAESLFITQQSLSRHIAKLEQRLGTELFSRNGNRLELTDAGKLFYEETCLLMEHWDRILADTRRAAADKRLPVHIGIIHGMERYFMPLIFEKVRPEFPDFDLILSVVTEGRSIFDRVESGALDMAIALSVSDSETEKLETHFLWDCNMTLMISEDALARFFDGSYEDLLEQISIHGSAYVLDRVPLLLPESQSTDEVFLIGSVYENSDIAMLNCINGLGVTFCPDFMEPILCEQAFQLGKKVLFLPHSRTDVAKGRVCLCGNRNLLRKKQLAPLQRRLIQILKTRE